MKIRAGRSLLDKNEASHEAIQKTYVHSVAVVAVHGRHSRVLARAVDRLHQASHIARPAGESDAGVTTVNDCRYCSWAHTGLALANGVDLDELTQLLDSGTFGTVDDREATAILFAKHYADTLGEPSNEAHAALARHFPAYQRAEIMAYIRFIYYANLSGNSLDAWLGRLSGRKVVDGHPLPEAIAALIAAPVGLMGMLLSRKIRPEAMQSFDEDTARKA